MASVSHVWLYLHILAIPNTHRVPKSLFLLLNTKCQQMAEVWISVTISADWPTGGR